MSQRHILVLGGGHGQLSLINRLKEQNIRVAVQDQNPHCPARSLADDFVEADTRDHIAAADAAIRYGVDAVLTTGTDQPVLAAARAAEARGCPSMFSEETALALTDKEVMKSVLTNAGVRTPKYRIAGAGSGLEVLNGLKKPFVIKPVDSQGQRGVMMLNSPDDFLRYRDESLKWSRRGRLIVEEYHRNQEITVSGWVYRGNTSIWAVTDRVTRDFPPHIGLCLAHRYPSVYAAGYNDEVKNLTLRCVEALGVYNGPIYFQFLISDSGIMVNETAGRLGGAYEDISLPPVCGTDLLGILIAGAVNGRANPDDEEFNVPLSASSFAVPLMFCHPGKVNSNGNTGQIMNFPGITSFKYLLPPGTLVRNPANSIQRAAYMVVHGESPSDVNRILKRVWPRIRVVNSEGRQSLRNTIGYALNPN